MPAVVAKSPTPSAPPKPTKSPTPPTPSVPTVLQVERGKATKEELKTFEAAQEAKKEVPMEFRLILFGNAMPGLIPKMYDGKLVGLDASEDTVAIEVSETGSVLFIPKKKVG